VIDRVHNQRPGCSHGRPNHWDPVIKRQIWHDLTRRHSRSSLLTRARQRFMSKLPKCRPGRTVSAIVAGDCQCGRRSSLSLRGHTMLLPTIFGVVVDQPDFVPNSPSCSQLVQTRVGLSFVAVLGSHRAIIGIQTSRASVTWRSLSSSLSSSLSHVLSWSIRTRTNQ
jgi:hypothetical protein